MARRTSDHQRRGGPGEGDLPFTGLTLAGLVLAAAVLLSAGPVLRDVEQRKLR